MIKKRIDILKGLVSSREPQSRYLIQSIELEETEPPVVLSALVAIIAGFVVIGIIWAGFTRVDETAIAEGKVVPESDIQAVQHLEGGIVAEILVREGEIVERHQALLRLATTDAKSQLDQISARRAATLLEIERHRAIAEGRAPNFNARIDGFGTLKEDQLAVYTTQVKAYESQKQVLQDRLEQELAEDRRLKNKIPSVEHDLQLLREEYDLRKNLFECGLTTRQSLLGVQREVSQLEANLEETRDLLNGVVSALSEARERIGEIEYKARAEARSRVGELAARLAELNEALKSLKDRTNRLEVVAPVTGIVQHLAVKAVNAVVQPGETLLEIVPIDDRLLVEARISPKDIGQVYIGQEVDLRISTYDFAIHGSVPGKLVRLSATTFQSPEGEHFYRGVIEPEHVYVGRDPGVNVILPGMVVQANLKIGQKSILDYILKPVYRGFSNAFRER